jgi:hypothetical protein
MYVNTCLIIVKWSIQLLRTPTDVNWTNKITVTIASVGVPGDSVSSVSDFGLEDQGSVLRKIFSLTSASRSALGPTQSPARKVTGGKARPGRDADYSPSSSAEVENK